MKKIVWSLALAVTLVACGKQNEPILEPKNPEIEEPSKKDEPKQEAPKGEDPNEDAPKTDEPKPNQPNPDAPKPDEPNTKPTDFYLGTRMQVNWGVKSDVYLKAVDFESLFVHNNAQGFTMEKLKPYLKIYSTDLSGKPYTLTDEDLKLVQIIDVRYENNYSGNGSITFKTKYKSYQSDSRHSLPFDRNAFYANKVELDLSFAGKWYMRGVAKYLALFYGDAVTYDRNLYAAELDEQSIDYRDSDNSIRFNLVFKYLETDKELAQIPITLIGFKSLKTLEQDMFVSQTHELKEVMTRKVHSYKEGRDLAKHIESGISNWMKSASVGIRQGERAANMLQWETVSVPGGSVNTLTPETGRKRDLDIYLEDPRFSVAEAKFVGRNLELKLKLNYVNTIALDNVILPLTVHGVKN
ncbi:hypothetical protein [Porphyromonas sp. COT-290 OH860]|uniref:hypothetical protein n=1 Tax=Porphyromonas sp. COT-290 OH860 TaxID=1515615 RepID=UPI00052CE9F0|nr:hypothetical protein [Porphyromonas sp. COT-290 OH860]KGN84305.1 hypothetical protein HQ41_05005 [Porphyromonas sp. COT-290 OH860]